MSLDFSNVKSWNIPEGEVLSASLNGVTVWTKQQQHTYEPTSQNGDGLYGLVDGVYYPLTATSTTVTTYTYKSASGNVSDGYRPYYKTGTLYYQYGDSLSTISANNQWNSQTWLYKDSSTATTYYYYIQRTSSSSTTWTYTLPNGNSYTGQRYIQTS